MKAARFSVQFEINYHQNKDKRLKKRQFSNTGLFCQAWVDILHKGPSDVLSIIIFFFFASRPSMFYQPISVARRNIRIL